jgi:methylenetetrahydrofolate--tRNA-(uracil-5-)-methyltransferase
MASARITVVGAGLAGAEACWQLAERGFSVDLVDQKPLSRTPAQSSDLLAELVCSNSLRGASLANAVGLLKEELRRAGSLILRAADATRVAAGGALAVDRDAFARFITSALESHPRIQRHVALLTEVPTEPSIVATGPLTSDALATDLARLVGAEHLAYYDAIAPIVTADSIDETKVFRASRWGKGDHAEPEGDAAYVNCPLNRAEYDAFVASLLAAEKSAPRPFEEPRYFEGCLPIEVMAARGERTLAFGPMKPVGLVDPHTGRRPFAVVQLRAEDRALTAYNLVGFQTRMTHAAQAQVFRTIPGLQQAVFLRFGGIHRNTFVDSPKLLGPSLELRVRPQVHLAGQLTGVEGYVESAASGFVCSVMVAQKWHQVPSTPPPNVTALGALLEYVLRPQPRFQPSNITWACFPPLGDPKLRKLARYEALAARSLLALDGWLENAPFARIRA